MTGSPYMGPVLATQVVGVENPLHYYIVVLRDDQVDRIADRVVEKLQKNVHPPTITREP